ncbi:hypothetical protein DQ04_12111000, partial [Trypanosoma grayi]|uniref:hypothetical protein n=1 Tax=Trypanosoma grayi TaxID=71804 RepID=UPI0004F41EEF
MPINGHRHLETHIQTYMHTYIHTHLHTHVLCVFHTLNKCIQCVVFFFCLSLLIGLVPCRCQYFFGQGQARRQGGGGDRMLEGDIDDVWAVVTEVAVAELLAAAANSGGGSGPAAVATATILLRLPRSPDSWSRRERDAFLLCLDRAVGRVYPPL